MYTQEAIFDQGKASFQLQPEDNPENLWFYSAWFGLKALAAAKGIDIELIHHQAHHALCMSQGQMTLEAIFANLQDQAAKLQLPEKPKERYTSSDYEPTWTNEDVERRAKEFFNSQFKRSFPGKRLNSKFAKDKWIEVKEKAMGFALESYQLSHQEWQVRENRRQAERAEREAGWQEACDRIETIRRAILALTATTNKE